MLNKIILASKRKVRKDILDKKDIERIVATTNVDEDKVKLSLHKWGGMKLRLRAKVRFVKV